MTKKEFIDKMNEYLETTGLSEGAFECYYTCGDEKNIDTTFYIDEVGDLYIRAEDSIIRIKTSINVKNVEEFRYSEWGSDECYFYIICDDYSGLYFSQNDVFYFENGSLKYGEYKKAIEWFTEHPVE